MLDSTIRSFSLPTVMTHGPGAVARLPAVVAELGLRRPLLVTDPGMVAAGLAERVTRLLDAARSAYVVFGEVVSNPPVALIDRGAEVYRRENCDGLIGLGGGSSLDTAKGIGVVVTHGGS